MAMHMGFSVVGNLGGMPPCVLGMTGPLGGMQPDAAPVAIGAARADQRARILVVEDHAFVRAGIVGLLNGEPDFVCCGECDTVAGTRLAVAKCKPDVILLDLNLKDGQALGLIGGLLLEFPDAKILVLSQLDEAIYAPKVLRSGARGYLMKETASQKLFEALRVVLSGGTYLSQEMAGKLRLGDGAKVQEWAARFMPRAWSRRKM